MLIAHLISIVLFLPEARFSAHAFASHTGSFEPIIGTISLSGNKIGMVRATAMARRLECGQETSIREQDALFSLQRFNFFGSSSESFYV